MQLPITACELEWGVFLFVLFDNAYQTKTFVPVEKTIKTLRSRGYEREAIFLGLKLLASSFEF